MIKYQEVARNIRKKILNGEYVAGKQLPLEKEMCVYYGVSRITIKRALDELVKQGLVIKRRGSGTFVKSVEDEDIRELSALRQFTGFSETYKNCKVETTIIKFDIIHPSEEVAAKLQMTVEDFVYNIIRARYADGRPIVVEYTQMPIGLIPGIKRAILEKSIYSYIQKELQLKIQSAHRTLRAVMPNEMEQEYLRIKDTVMPLLEVEQVAFLDDGRPFEYSISRHRGDEIEFKTVSMK